MKTVQSVISMSVRGGLYSLFLKKNQLFQNVNKSVLQWKKFIIYPVTIKFITQLAIPTIFFVDAPISKLPAPQ